MATIIQTPFPGNLLFIAVPDEENASAGAHTAVQALPGIAAEKKLDIQLVINLDAIADNGNGEEGQVLATGTIGKMLPFAMVIGRPVHSGYATRGLNAAVCAAAIATKMEWATELIETDADGSGTAPTLLGIRDGKSGYDVTTPETAYAFWNVLFKQRAPNEILSAFKDLTAAAINGCLADLSQKLGGWSSDDVARLDEHVPIWSYSDLLTEVETRDPTVREHLLCLSRDLKHLDYPERSRRIVLELWRKSQLPGPAVIIGLGAPPYLSTGIKSKPILDYFADFASRAQARYGTGLRLTSFFQGISDMSSFGEINSGDPNALALLSPVSSMGDGEANYDHPHYATVNLGPWGRDYHTPFERINVAYSFGILPHMLKDLATGVLNNRPRGS